MCAFPGGQSKIPSRSTAAPSPPLRPGEYLPIRRRWSAGDAVELNFDMQPQAVHANLAVADDRGRIAFQRGPIVYCMEQLDQAVGAADTGGFPRYTAQLTETTATALPA